jgi:CheY-like chemotaxis protein
MSLASNHRILIVDDNRAIHGDFRKIFAAHATDTGIDELEALLLDRPAAAAPAPAPTFELVSASQGREALDHVVAALADHRPFALAFVDMRMPPGWDGLETIERIWQVDPDIQIVICSAFSDHSRSDLLARFGVRESLLILNKPFDTIEVAQCANALTTKWTLAQRLRAHVHELEDALAVRTRQLSDSNAELAIQLAHEPANELVRVLDGLTRDCGGLFAFLDETDQALRDLAASGAQATQLHTLKGNTALFGFRWFSAQCHALESQLVAGTRLGADQLEDLRARWRQSLEQLRPFLGHRDRNGVTLGKDELADQVAQLRRAGVAPALLAGLDRWQLEPVGPALDRLAREAEQIAAHQGKQVAITVHGGRVRLADDRMRRLLPPLIHAVRNAVDHGLEPVAERLAAGKPAAGQLVLACTETATELVLSVTDDGRGVRWERARDRALRLGLPAATPADLVEALFSDGVSTADAVTETSGRGVGLGALRAVCRALGGAVDLASEPGHGTRVSCVIPFAASPDGSPRGSTSQLNPA